MHNITPRLKREHVDISSGDDVLDIGIVMQRTVKKETVKSGNRPSLPKTKQISKATNKEIVPGEIS